MSVVVFPRGVTLVAGVCTWHLAEVVAHRSSRREGQSKDTGWSFVLRRSVQDDRGRGV
jgi:hypothetical protein